MKENVLEIETINAFDVYVVRIKYQNEKVLKRGSFNDLDLYVKSENCFFFNGETLFLRGKLTKYDNKTITLNTENYYKLIDRVNAINEKYGVEKNWRAGNGEFFFTIDRLFNVDKIQDLYFDCDGELHKAKNYFKTREEAELVAIKFREVLKEYLENK